MHSVLLDFGGLCKDYSELVNGAEYQISLAVTKIFRTFKLKYNTSLLSNIELDLMMKKFIQMRFYFFL